MNTCINQNTNVVSANWNKEIQNVTLLFYLLFINAIPVKSVNTIYIFWIIEKAFFALKNDENYKFSKFKTYLWKCLTHFITRMEIYLNRAWTCVISSHVIIMRLYLIFNVISQDSF